MSVELDHTPRYWNAMKRLHWRVASDVGAAVLRFAARPDVPSGWYEVRARGEGKGYAVAVLVDRGRGAVIAESIYRTKR